MINDKKTREYILSFIEENIDALKKLADHAYDASENGMPDMKDAFIGYNRDLSHWVIIRNYIKIFSESEWEDWCVHGDCGCEIIERKKFEAWLESQSKNPFGPSTWDAWQARAALDKETYPNSNGDLEELA